MRPDDENFLAISDAASGLRPSMKDGVVEWLATIPIVDATMRVPGLRGAHPRGYEALQRAAANRNSAKE
jgi:hypothetical protein